MSDPYTTSAQCASKRLTQEFSTSFSSATKLFDKSYQQDIYNIYGLVRVADEIVDTYRGPDARQQLDDLESEVYAALKRSFSANVIVHSFVVTARAHNIDTMLIQPFFNSMRMDLDSRNYTQKMYQKYIFGSAEVVGLMCLKVFVRGDKKAYTKLKPGAQALGAAFQKVNFLRDIKDDYERLGRYYFPIGSYQTFGESEKAAIISDVEKDFSKAQPALQQLPRGVRRATKLAFAYYKELLETLKQASAAEIKESRLRVSTMKKLTIRARATVQHRGK